MLRKIYYTIPQSLRPLVRKLYYFPQDVFHFLFGGNELRPPKGSVFVGNGDFKKQGELFQIFFKRFTNLAPHHKVLDVGSGIGRMAVPFMDFLDKDGRYHGFDLVQKGINWCQENITKRDDRFEFIHADIHNELYNTNGKIKATEYQFPYADNSFDFIFLTSVFTHMMPEEIAHYLSEIARVLKPTGQSFITYFILDQEAIQNIEAGRSHKNFSYDKGPYRLMSEKVNTANVAYDIDWLKAVYAKNGLSFNDDQFHRGWWSGKAKGNDYQDIVVSGKLG